MEKRIQLEKRGQDANQIKELNLDNCRSTTIEGLTDDFSSLEKLSLINVGLTSLKSFPKLPSLKKLELSDNRISNGLNHIITSSKLTSLNLSGNKIKDFDELKPLSSLDKLEILDLFNNEVTQAENYRTNVFELIPSLKFLDGFDKDDNEAPSDDEDEINGNDDEEDEVFPERFSANGIDIDLKELEELERKIALKAKLQLDCNVLTERFENELQISDEFSQSNSQRPSLSALFVFIMSVLSVINQIHYTTTATNEIEDEEDSDEEDEDDDDGPGLKEVYNDALDDDEESADWNQEEDEEDEEIDSEEDADETAEKANVSADGTAEESPTRGKKRKHEGD